MHSLPKRGQLTTPNTLSPSPTMQAQAVQNNPTEVVTSQQSLQSIQTLLRAGLGCITYLRNLLPADNFSESYLTAANPELPSSQGSTSFDALPADVGRRTVSGFKVMTVTRGYTEEADKLLDYLENGIFDALQHQYLRSFIFAVYLDQDDPNNIIEAYTFNFRYHSIPGTSSVVPIMTLGEDLMNMSLSDPVVDATKQGRIPTLGEVKKSLKGLIKNLIHATTQMDPLPRRRFATFKLYYYGHTPEDYQPPHFRAGDSEKDRWVFTTHDHTEMPEKCSVGNVQTGWHGIDVRVASVAGYLPSLEDNNAPFLGTTAGRGPTAPVLTPVEEAAARVQQAEVQRSDAAERRVAWDAEDGLINVNERGLETPAEDDIQKSWRSGQTLLGLRDESGSIVPISNEIGQSVDCLPPLHLKEGHYVGVQEDIPSRVGQLRLQVPRPTNMERTQLVDPPHTSASLTPRLLPRPQHLVSAPSTQLSARPHSPSQSLPPSDVEDSITPLLSSVDAESIQVVTQPANAITQDEEMLDLETQVLPTADDPITSFSSGHPDTAPMESGPSVEDVPMVDGHEHEAVECECGVEVEDCDIMLCDGPCKKWYHTWCMGYHGAEEVEGDFEFMCFDCRVHADKNWELIKLHDFYPRMMQRYQDVAVLRRAIKIYETHNPPGLAAFVKLIGVEAPVARQLFKRLESEGFIAQEVIEEGEFMGTTMRNNKRKDKRGKRFARGQVQPGKFVFVNAMKTSQSYRDYFSHDPYVEKRILGLADLKPKRLTRSSSQNRNAPPALEDMMQPSSSEAPADHLSDAGLTAAPDGGDSQTQPEEDSSTPALPMPVTPRGAPEKRRTSDSSAHERTTKKSKISVGFGVDLGD
ncbi:DNA binding protein [Steccherinum ochraceum]|uniref:DNA binding protein n=1 Tax=Steccherinum ochraceum TaxID=92696 RepID=A0A4R0RWH3_9APHY|nr:DNA binding protein [Steccherinum ochraceum]